jgi:hypothetical protein
MTLTLFSLLAFLNKQSSKSQNSLSGFSLISARIKKAISNRINQMKKSFFGNWLDASVKT